MRNNCFIVKKINKNKTKTKNKKHESVHENAIKISLHKWTESYGRKKFIAGNYNENWMVTSILTPYNDFSPELLLWGTELIVQWHW